MYVKFKGQGRRSKVKVTGSDNVLDVSLAWWSLMDRWGCTMMNTPVMKMTAVILAETQAEKNAELKILMKADLIPSEG